MKSFLLASVAMFSLSAFAQYVAVPLDASCVVECVISVKQEPTMSGYRNVEVTKKLYFDVSGLERRVMDKYLEQKTLSICEKQFGTVISAGKPDCLFFKH